ncbi:GCY-22 protein [Aphelenchoides avenae]|nr:GCY-22 protein [Aphelenchus avenae]
MLTDEYVYVFIVATRMGFGDPPFWEDTRNETDGKDAIVKKACEKVLVLDTQQTNASSPEFNDAVVGNMHKWPFYCDDCPKDGNASRSSASMADAFYIYANALNRTIEEVGEDGARNGTLIAQHSNGVYQGVSGKLVISNGGYKRPIFFLYALDSKGNQKHMATVNSDEAETRLNSLWQIPFHMLIRQDQKSDIARSYRSIQSGISASTKSSIMVKKDTARTLYCFYNKEAVIARKIDYRMRNVDHENLNKFLGICLESPKIKSLWRYCSRGSIADIIEQDSTTLDAFIATSLMRDICEGLFFIHNSSILKQHGCLTSSACLVSDRWQVKVQEYGLSAFKAVQARQKKDKSNLWVAPEILRSRENCIGSKPGDIYSFAIICSELISRRPAWNLGENELNLEQILYNVQRGRHPPYRPDMTDEGVHHNPRLIQLVRECWDESPERRPKIDAIRESLKAVTLNNASTNLMDYIFNLLESNASALEQEVDERMKELIAEKKKSDILLYRMLPRAVADKLKLGVTAEPELFEAVTVFFSDIVVNLLNELYTEFDSIIDQHDVYKVDN